MDEATERTVQLAEQARQVVAGNRTIPNPMVSFHDPQARPIRKGKLAKPTEFGYKVRVDETESGFVTGYEVVYMGNPADESLLVEGVEAHVRHFGQALHAVATDRGFSSRRNERELERMGVRYVSSPQRGKKGAKRTKHEEHPWFRDLQGFRTAGEARISLLKRRYGLLRSRYRGHKGTKIWVGFGIPAHNLHRAARM